MDCSISVEYVGRGDSMFCILLSLGSGYLVTFLSEMYLGVVFPHVGGSTQGLLPRGALLPVPCTLHPLVNE